MTGVPESPYKGLAAFEDSELDALLFFGREREIDAVARTSSRAGSPSSTGRAASARARSCGAGVARRLRELSGAPVVVHDAWAEDPAGALIASVRAECGELGADGGPRRHGRARRRRQAASSTCCSTSSRSTSLYHGATGRSARRCPSCCAGPGCA